MRLDQMKIQTDSQGKIWSLELNDRRWKWRDLNAIDGWYNQLDPNGKLIPYTIRSPYELCLLCLQTMGEKRFVIDMPPGLPSAIGKGYSDFLVAGTVLPPTGTNPPVNWSGDNPAQALQRLAESFGRRVVYDPIGDVIHIVRMGLGKMLPGGSFASDSPSAKFPQIPDAAQVIGDDNRYQVRLEVEAVGKEYDGSLRPINELSYAPVIEAVLHRWTYTPATTGVAATWSIRFPTFNNIFFEYVDGAGTATATTICSYFVGQVNANPVLNKVLVAVADAGVLTLLARKAGENFDVMGYVQPTADIDPDAGETAPTVNLKLVDVGRERKKTWDYCAPPLFANVVATDRLTYAQAQDLAMDSIWKLYRITGRDVRPRINQDSKDHPAFIPGYGEIVRKQQIIITAVKVDQIVPKPEERQLLDKLNRPVVLNYYNGYSKDMPAQVFGSVSRTAIAPSFFITSRDGEDNTPPGSAVYAPFSVDPIYQTIKFNTHIYKIGSDSAFVEPTLVLECAVMVRDPDTNQTVKFVARRNFKPNPQIIASTRRPDVQLNVTSEYNERNQLISTQLLELDAIARANYYLDGMQVQYFTQISQQRVYNGIVPIGLDGAVMQVTWSTGSDGAKTQASRNSEHDINVPPYPARRRIENMRPGSFEKIANSATPDRTRWFI
jgi:hypothetical protein